MDSPTDHVFTAGVCACGVTEARYKADCTVEAKCPIFRVKPEDASWPAATLAEVTFNKAPPANGFARTPDALDRLYIMNLLANMSDADRAACLAAIAKEWPATFWETALKVPVPAGTVTCASISTAVYSSI